MERKQRSLGEKYGKDADRLIDKYSGSTIAMRVLAHTFELIESYDKEAFEKQMADFERMLKDALARKTPRMVRQHHHRASNQSTHIKSGYVCIVADSGGKEKTWKEKNHQN
ncbi:MAG: hypothetical protein ACLTIG_07145 [Roseburia hominis]